MSLFDSASLVVTPNGVKEDKLYSIKPTDGSGDLVVTRATTATRVNSDGLIEQVPYNLLTYSEQFNNADWAKTNSTITANNITAPNGALTADKVIPNTTNGSHIVGRFVAINNSTAHTVSLYAKKGEYSGLRINYISSGNTFISVNLNNGIIESFGGTIYLSSSIESVGNDWYRITMTFLPPAATNSLNFLVENPIGTTTFAGDNTSGIYIWGAQLVTGTSAKEYFPTTDRLDVPRLDYTNSSCPSILVEPQRTNLATYSEQFDNANWVKLNATITANTSVAPTGNTTADTLTITSGGYLLQTLFGYNAVSGQSITISIFAKNQITNFLTFGGATTAGTDVYTIQDYGNGWYRHIRTRTFSVTNASANIQFIIFNQIGTHIVWGAQIEAGSNATSYVPTVASSVTRNADVISKTGISSLIGQTEGTIFIDFNINDLQIQTIDPVIFSTSGTNYIRLFTTGVISYFESNTVSVVSASNVINNGRNKIAVNYKNNDFSLYVNGVLVGSNNSGSVVAKSNFALRYLPTALFDPKLFYNSIVFFPTKLTGAESINLTTI